MTTGYQLHVKLNLFFTYFKELEDLKSPTNKLYHHLKFTYIKKNVCGALFDFKGQYTSSE